MLLFPSGTVEEIDASDREVRGNNVGLFLCGVVWFVSLLSAFAMSGELAWQVKTSLIKVCFVF